MNKLSNEPIQNLPVKKSNDLVAARYNSTLMENAITAVAIARIQANAADKDSPLEAVLYPGELKRLIGDPAHIYRTLKTVSTTMLGHTIFIEDKKGNFKGHAIVIDATYIDGVFRVKFNESIRNHILGLEAIGNYTTMEISVLTAFKRNSSFRIFELLKKEIYRSDPRKNDGRVDVEYKLSEFRFMIGLADADNQLVKNEIGRMGSHVNWDILYEKLDKKDRKYEKWYELVRNVLVPAQEELLEKSNIRFDYEGARAGRSIDRIIFHIYPNELVNKDRLKERQRIVNECIIRTQYEKEKNEENRQLDFPRDIEGITPLYDEFIGHNELTVKDIDYLVKVSGMNVDLIREAIREADEQPKIDNYMGWLVGCIRAGGYQKIETMNGSHKEAVDYRRREEEFKSPEHQKKLWEMVKGRDDFEVFLNFERETKGVTLDELEFIYSPEEANKEYVEWKKKNV